MIYLDNAASTRVSPEVLEAMLPFFDENYGNSNSIHAMGKASFDAIERAKEQLAHAINAPSTQGISFAPSGSEANAIAIRSAAAHMRRQGKNHIITSQVEHSSIIEYMRFLESKGFKVTYLPVSSKGAILPEILADAFRHDTGLVSIMGVNNETGNAYDIDALGKICKQNNVLFHTDCVQALGSTEIDVSTGNIDFLTASGHKIHGPKGIGLIYSKDNDMIDSPVFEGTQNVPAIAGFGQAAALLDVRAEVAHNTKIGMRFLSQIKKVDGVYVNGRPHCGSKIINLRFDNIDGETLLLLLNSKGLMVSAGSACNSNFAEPSHVLRAIGLSELEARSSIRVSFSKYTTEQDIDEAVAIIAASVKELRDSKKITS